MGEGRPTLGASQGLWHAHVLTRKMLVGGKKPKLKGLLHQVIIIQDLQ